MSRQMGKNERAEKCLLSLDMALYHAVHSFPGGVGAVAGAHGMSASTLQNKLNPSVESHKINLRDFELIALTTQDERILQSVCSLFNAAYFMLPKTFNVDSSSLLQKGAEVTREVSELMQQVSLSIADGKINQDEVNALERELLELFSAAKGLIEYAKIEGGFIEGDNHGSN